MIKPHIKKLSKGSKIFECMSREPDEAYPFQITSGHGLSPHDAFTNWKERRKFLEGYAPARIRHGFHFVPNGTVLSIGKKHHDQAD